MLFKKLCFFVAAALALVTGQNDNLSMLLAWTDTPGPLRMVFDVFAESPTPAMPFEDTPKFDTFESPTAEIPFDDTHKLTSSYDLDAEIFAPLDDGEIIRLHDNTTVGEQLGMQPLNFVLQMAIVTSFIIAFFIVFLLITCRKRRVANYNRILDAKI
jgi:hypothetical protein